MTNLLLAILSSAMVSILMRLGESRVRNTMVLFLTNYTVCSLTSLYFLRPLVPAGPGGLSALGMGLLGGVLFLTSFAMFRINIRKNGVVLSAIFMKLGVLVPLFTAVVLFHEEPTFLQILGFLVAVAAMVMVNLGAERTAPVRSAALLLLLPLLGGLADAMINIYDKSGAPAWKDHFLLFIFLSAGLLCLAIALWQRKPFGLADVLFGLIVGIPNYFSSRFLMLSLTSLPAVVAYPVCNVGTIILITLTGVLAFREKLNRPRLIGIGLILLALVLLNI